MHHLPPIADNIIVAKIIAVKTLLLPIVRLALPPRGREETFFAFAPTANARGIAWVVDASQVAFHFSTAAGNAGLVDTFVLWLTLRGRLRLLLDSR